MCKMYRKYSPEISEEDDYVRESLTLLDYSSKEGRSELLDVPEGIDSYEKYGDLVLGVLDRLVEKTGYPAIFFLLHSIHEHVGQGGDEVYPDDDNTFQGGETDLIMLTLSYYAEPIEKRIDRWIQFLHEEKLIRQLETVEKLLPLFKGKYLDESEIMYQLSIAATHLETIL